MHKKIHGDLSTLWDFCVIRSFS